MSYKPVSLERNNDIATFMYNDVNIDEFPSRLEKFFKGQDYKLESGTNEKGVYGTGSNIMRILFGAFVKRYTFQFKLAGGEFQFAVIDREVTSHPYSAGQWPIVRRMIHANADFDFNGLTDFHPQAVEAFKQFRHGADSERLGLLGN